jgi:hypothetical protein
LALSAVPAEAVWKVQLLAESLVFLLAMDLLAAPTVVLLA